MIEIIAEGIEFDLQSNSRAEEAGLNFCYTDNTILISFDELSN